MRLQCPECQRLLEIDDRPAGAQAMCPHCRRELIIPVPTPQAGEGARPAAAGEGRKRRKPLRLVLAAVVALGLLYVIVAALMFISRGGGGLDDFIRYIPQNAAYVARFDLAALRSTGVLEDLGAVAKTLRLGVGGALTGLGLDAGEVAEVVVAGSPGGGRVVMLRTRDDVKLEDVVGSGRRDFDTYEGVRYARPRGGDSGRYVAEAPKRTYFVARDEDEMKRALTQAGCQQASELSPDLVRALREVSFHEHYVAGTGERVLPGAKAAGVGASVGSRVRAKLALVFEGEAEAREAGKVIKGAVQELTAWAEEQLAGASDEQRPRIESALKVLQRVRVEQRADMVYVTGSCRRQDLSPAAAVLGEKLSAMLDPGVLGPPQSTPE